MRNHHRIHEVNVEGKTSESSAQQIQRENIFALQFTRRHRLALPFGYFVMLGYAGKKLLKLYQMNAEKVVVCGRILSCRVKIRRKM
jgi:hypothetical protein